MTNQLDDASDRFAEYLLKLVKGAAEVVNERELALEVKYPGDTDTDTNKYKTDELYHN